MKHISINVSKEIRSILPETLEKDLCDNEDICPVCNGLGVVLDNNVYGIKGDTSEAAKKSMFPYNHQAIKCCSNCYNGVIHLCQYCGKQIQRGYIDKCDCEQYKAKEEEEKRMKYQEQISKAEEVNIILKISTLKCGSTMNIQTIIFRILTTLLMLTKIQMNMNQMKK